MTKPNKKQVLTDLSKKFQNALKKNNITLTNEHEVEANLSQVMANLWDSNSVITTYPTPTMNQFLDDVVEDIINEIKKEAIQKITIKNMMVEDLTPKLFQSVTKATLNEETLFSTYTKQDNTTQHEASIRKAELTNSKVAPPPPPLPKFIQTNPKVKQSIETVPGPKPRSADAGSHTDQEKNNLAAIIVSSKNEATIRKQATSSMTLKKEALSIDR